MKVWNPTDAGVFVKGYGVLPPGEDATVTAEAGEPLTGSEGPLKAGNPPKAAQEQQDTTDNEKEGDG